MCILLFCILCMSCVLGQCRNDQAESSGLNIARELADVGIDDYILPENCNSRYIHIKGEDQSKIFKESDI